MNLAIFFDTETTGLPDFKSPSDAPQQPHIVQIAAAMVDLDTKTTVQTIDLTVRPDGWVIPKEVSDIHGITHEMAMDVGVNEEEAINAFIALMETKESTASSPVFRPRIAHNASFDDRIMRIAFKRYIEDEYADRYKKAESYCTMRAATPIVKCPPTEKMKKAGRHHFKNPNLGECVQHFFGYNLDNAHNALVDVEACIDVYFAIQDQLAKDMALGA